MENTAMGLKAPVVVHCHHRWLHVSLFQCCYVIFQDTQAVGVTRKANDFPDHTVRTPINSVLRHLMRDDTISYWLKMFSD
eukprot:8482896-Karenia_brevis.AAC.1